MKAFLEQVAEALLAAHGPDLREVAVVLPGQRAGTYLRRWLAQAAGGPLWSPELFTLDTFLERRSGLRPLPPEELLLEAYEAYRTVAGDEVQPLGEFLLWAPTALTDISEADAHLVPLDGFYRDLRSWEELDWSFNDTPLSRGQERMVHYWALKGRMHAALNARLLGQGTGTNGLIARTAAERPDASPLPWRAVWFVGLNAFTPAQERVVAHVHQQGRARFAWDADRYYLDDVRQEAGDHLRKAIGRFGPGVVPPGTRLAEGTIRLHVVRAPNDAAQAWCAGDRLARYDEAQRASAAVVLADSALLQPMLEALPAGLGPVNITMGLPLAQLPAASLVEAFLRLHAAERPGQGYFHADVERLLRHPYVRDAASAEGIELLLREVTGAQRTYVPAELLRDRALAFLPPPMGAYAAAAFSPVADARTEMPDRTAQLLAWARQAMADDAFATEQLYQLALTLRRVQRSLARYAHPLEQRSYAFLLERLVRAARIGLFGEPLSGVQVMGMLETRALDPAHILLLGAQEGSLPSGGDDRSFIPFELRRAYGLPLRESTDAVQAYNLLRMVQRAEEVVLIHPETEGSAGPSRFILQLEHERYRHRPELFRASDARVMVPLRNEAHVAVAKDAAVIAAVQRLLAQGLTPTMLGDHLRCPLDFHFRRILRLQEPGTPEARIGGNVLGDALHRTIEAVHRPWLGMPLDPELLEQAAAQVGPQLRRELEAQLPADVLAQGQPLLQAAMAVRAAERFLHHEARTVRQGTSILPLALEEPFQCAVPGAVERLGVPMLLKGRLDRVDDRDGILHILDLKTGRVDPATLAVKELTLDVLRGEKRYAAQLLVYAWLYLMQNPQVPLVKAGLQPMQRSAGSSGLFLRVDGSPHITRDLLPVLSELFLAAAAEMLDPGAPFRHDPDSRYCAFCITG